MNLICFDLEGPLSPQDNAYELMKLFPGGDKIFEVVSRYDDLLTLEERADYEPGDTLALIVPFLILHDISEAYIQLFSNLKTRGEIFNIGTNRTITLMEVIEKVQKLLGIPNLDIIEENPRQDYDHHLTDSSKIRSFIPWEPRIKLETTLKDMIEALL